MIAVFLGPPGSGKGTQAEMIADLYDYTHLSTGRLLREMKADNKNIAEVIDAGGLIPDDMLLDILKSHLEKNNLFNNLILDGTPRTVYQYKKLAPWLRKKGSPIRYVIYLHVDEETAIQRISFRRHHKKTGKIYNLKTSSPPPDVDYNDLIARDDQTPEAIKKRFVIYREKTLPLVEYLRKRNKLIEIDGTKTIETIHHRILEAIKHNNA